MAPVDAATMALVACRHVHGMLSACRHPTSAAYPRLRIRATWCHAAGHVGEDATSQRPVPSHSQPSAQAMSASLGGGVAPRRALSGKPRMRLTLPAAASSQCHGLHQDAQQEQHEQQERAALDISPQHVEEVLETLLARRSTRAVPKSGRNAESAAADAEVNDATWASISEKFRETKARRADLTVAELDAGMKVLCNLVPGVKEKQLLYLSPEVLRMLCSDAGASAAATCLLQLQAQDPAGTAAMTPWDTLQAVLQSPELLLLTGRGQLMPTGIELECSGAVAVLAFAQQGMTLVTVGRSDEFVKVWDLQEAEPSFTIIDTWADVFNYFNYGRKLKYSTHLPSYEYREQVHSIAVHPDGRHVVVCGSSSHDEAGVSHVSLTLSLIDLETERMLTGAIGDEQEVPLRVATGDIGTGVIGGSSVALLPATGGAGAGKLLVVAAAGRLGVDAFELDTEHSDTASFRFKFLRDSPTTRFVAAVAAVPGSQSVVAAGRVADLWSDVGVPHVKPHSKRLGSSVASKPGKGVHKVAVCPRGKLAAGCMYQEPTVLVWDLETCREVARLNCKDRGDDAELVKYIAISPDGRHLVGGDVRGRLLVWDLQSFEQVASLASPKANEVSLTCLAFSPADSASQVLAIGDEEGLVRLLDWQELLGGF